MKKYSGLPFPWKWKFHGGSTFPWNPDRGTCFFAPPTKAAKSVEASTLTWNLYSWKFFFSLSNNRINCGFELKTKFTLFIFIF